MQRNDSTKTLCKLDLSSKREREKKSDERIKGVFLGVLFLFNVDRD